MNANISNKVRRDIYRRDGFRCALCDSTDGLQIHHVVHRGKGGGRENPMNLICLCWRCHSAAHGSVYQLDDYAFAVITVCGKYICRTIAPPAPPEGGSRWLDNGKEGSVRETQEGQQRGLD